MTRPSVSRGLPPSRRLEPSPPDTLVELHVYLVPKEKWLEARRLAKNQVVDDAVSIGFVRVFPDISIYNLRREILLQLGTDVIPSDYVFLRSVGRNFTQVKLKQEHQLKATNFVPPNAREPEIYLLDVRDPRSTLRLNTRPNSPALLRRTANRNSDPHDMFMNSHIVSVYDNDTTPPVPTSPSSSHSPSPLAVPSSEDSGISASPRQQKQEIQTANNKTSEGEEIQNINNAFRMTENLIKVNTLAPTPIMENAKNCRNAAYNEHHQVSPRIQQNELNSRPAEAEDSSGELAVTFVILEQEEDEGVGESDKHASKAHDGERLLIEISEVLRERRDAERRRHLLVEKVTDLQHRLRTKREKSQQTLRDKLFAAKKEAMPLEEACASLRLELDVAHRELVASLEGRELPLRIRDGPSKKANYKITAARLQHEIKVLQQKVSAVKVRLDAETKLRAQADREVRQLRSDLSQKKLAVSALRSQMLGTLSTEKPHMSTRVFKTHH